MLRLFAKCVFGAYEVGVRWWSNMDELEFVGIFGAIKFWWRFPVPLLLPF